MIFLKARVECNQLQNNHDNYEFNLHNLSLMRGTISHRLLRWKLEMHMTFENRLSLRFKVNVFLHFSFVFRMLSNVLGGHATLLGQLQNWPVILFK